MQPQSEHNLPRCFCLKGISILFHTVTEYFNNWLITSFAIMPCIVKGSFLVYANENSSNMDLKAYVQAYTSIWNPRMWHF